MRLPRLKAAVAMLGLPWASSTAAQSVETRLLCRIVSEQPRYTYTFQGVFDGSPLHAWDAGSEQVQIQLQPASGSDGATLYYDTAGDHLIKISAVAHPRKAVGEARITATFTQDGVQIPLATSITGAKGEAYEGLAAANIDTNIPAVVTFAADGKTFSRASFPALGNQMDHFRLTSERAFVGMSRADAATHGCVTYNPSSNPCFLTTATVECIGLSDDCWELQTLRRFRDSVLMRSDEGRALVDQYYTSAPAIVAAVNARPDASAIWLHTYWTGIVPSAIAARVGSRRLALKLYRRMVASLLATLGPAATIG